MKELSQERINQLTEQAIIDCQYTNNYILSSIQNVNLIIDEKSD